MSISSGKFSVVSSQWSVSSCEGRGGPPCPPEALYQTYLLYPFAGAKRLYITAIFLPSAGGSFRIRATDVSRAVSEHRPYGDEVTFACFLILINTVGKSLLFLIPSYLLDHNCPLSTVYCSLPLRLKPYTRRKKRTAEAVLFLMSLIIQFSFCVLQR